MSSVSEKYKGTINIISPSNKTLWYTNTFHYKNKGCIISTLNKTMVYNNFLV